MKRVDSLVRLVGASACLLVLSTTYAISQTWTELATFGGPSGLDFHGFAGRTVAYDPVANHLIVFLPRSIGFGNEFPEPQPTGQVWVLTNANGLGGPANWMLLGTSGSVLPAIHYDSTAVYDESSNRLIVYGGGFYHTSPSLNGTFVLSGANGFGTPAWRLLAVGNAPCSPFGQAGSCTGPNDRLGSSSVYDPTSGRMISFGGDFAFYGTGRNDTRALTNANGLASPSNWVTLAPSGGAPAPRSYHTAVYDEANNRMIVFGGWDTFNPGSYYNDVWILENANGLSTPTWLLQATPPAPRPRAHHAAVYDSDKNRMIVFGGYNGATLGDLWQLDRANGFMGTPAWTQLLPSGSGPGPMSGHGAVFDGAHQRMIVVAGVPDATGTARARVWLLDFNVPPTVTVDNPSVYVDEGAVAYNTGSFLDPGNVVSLSASVGMIGSDTETGTWSWSFPTQDGPVQSQPVTITGTDSQEASSQVSFDLVVLNVAPELALSLSAAAIDENSFVTLSGNVGDPGIDDTQTVIIDWGDDSPSTALALGGGGGSFAAPHQYLDDNPTATPSDPYTIAVSVVDKDGAGDYEAAEVLVYNVPPTITSLSGPSGPLALGNPANVSASFTDVGTQDSHSCTFSWDDGSPSTTVSASGSCSSTHTYAAAGVYTVAVSVSDDDTGRANANFEYVVIYDPNGGFVTGGGWIQSPPGAYTPDPSLTGKANFGFVSKYKAGSTVPTGSTEFQFHAASLNFHSSNYDWLVVAGAKAQYKGSGTINGSGDYGFLLTATDGQVVGGGGVDKFRIKIWDKSGGAVVYDNAPSTEDIDYSNTQALGGGSIVIHK